MRTTIALGSLAALLTILRVGTIEVYTVSSASMVPTLPVGSTVIVAPIEPHRGDIIALDAPDGGTPLVKRLIGEGGDTISCCTLNDGILINGKEDTTYPTHSQFREHVPDTSIYVMGDNRDVSRDSRTYGSLSNTRIRGTVIAHITWPWVKDTQR